MRCSPFFPRLVLTAGSVLSLYAQTGRNAGRPIDFQKEIRPLLSENCFHCHGPDSTTRMAGLRLDQKDAALEARKNGSAIVPGKPDTSLLYQRITAEKPARRMPPISSHKTLTPQQVAIFKQWIEQGAPWKEHWAYKAPVKAQPPVVKNVAWSHSPIDRFLLAKIEAAGLTPAPAADKRTLIRRVALDATGLPPTPAEIDQYLKDTRPNAYEQMVDRYLGSPHYGEQRGRYWLDAARYADTHGIHVDNYREIWPYRDWVIQAFNHNMPFNEFTTEQLAGDLMPKPTLDQRIATGFHRCNVTTNEAGIIEDEYAEIYAKDRADTTAAVWLGMTVGCATCHDHKFDPILQKDFYALGAFFRNTKQKVMDDNIPDTPPVLVVPRAEDREEWVKISTRLAGIRKEMDESPARANSDFQSWLTKRSAVTSAHPLDEKDELYSANVVELSKTEGPYELGDGNVAGAKALRFKTNEGLKVEKGPRLDSEKPFSISTTFFFPKAEQSYVVVSHQNPKEKNRGWSLEVGGRVTIFRLVSDGGRAVNIQAAHLEQIKHGTWNQVTVSYDGSRRQSGLSLYLNGRAISTQGGGNQNTELPGDIGVDTPLILGKSLAEGAIADFRIFNRVVSEGEARLLNEWPAVSAALSKETSQLSDVDRKALSTWYLFKEDKRFRELASEQSELNTDAKAIARNGAITLVMQERADSKPEAHILFRGAYDQKRDLVLANTPSALPPMKTDMPKNRLGLAEWLFTPEHPLTARVTVNRMWQEIFGTGIVKTADDFGSQGEAPSHQELLDWLAVDFRENGWDVKRFYKEIFMTAAYRQSAQVTPLKVEKDADNRLISRGVRFRLDGEVVRDYALAASGLLAPQIGGPSVKPYQPEGVWEAVAMIGSNTRFYKPDHGDGLYRRSMYTFWKRSAPPANMDVFNAPTRESCTVRRERTNTPLQALVTMNDVQFVEAARVLAERSMENASDFNAQLDFVTTRLMGRPLALNERQIARKSYDGFQKYYEKNQADAEKLLNEGESKPDPALAPANFAAMTMLVNQLMNLDEVLNK